MADAALQAGYVLDSRSRDTRVIIRTFFVFLTAQLVPGSRHPPSFWATLADQGIEMQH